jgi:hypothetical protein
MDIKSIMNALAKRRTIFVSEADFQFALAWEIKNQYPEAEIRLEYCPVEVDSSIHIDIIVKLDTNLYPIELKYLTAGLDVVVNRERFFLKNQGAQDIRRYDFIEDISRIEKLAGSLSSYKTGYAILLSNDPNYWNAPRQNTCDADFRINEGAIRTGTLKWAPHTGVGTKKGRENSFNIIGVYSMNWANYSQINESRSGVFRYVCVEVG